MSGQRVTLCVMLLALLVPRLGAHGYGTRPPWVAAGVVRVLAPGDDAYLEVRIQHSGHLGARGALSAPDVFRIVQLGTAGSARSTPRWERELQRRPLAAGDTLVGGGVVARAPLALALFPGGEAFAVADRQGVSVQERAGGARFHASFESVFAWHDLAACVEEHDRNAVWPFGWLEAPPRTVALWSDGKTLVVALRTRSGQWIMNCVDATTGAVLPERECEAVLAVALAAPAAPEASIALELLAVGVAPSFMTDAKNRSSASPDVALTAARQILANERATLEARLVAARVVARSVLASRHTTSETAPSVPSLAGDLELATAAALRVLQSGDGHPSMDDLLAAEVLVGLASELAPERWAAPLAELALARGVPELFPALTALGAAGVTALADAWLAVEAGSLSPYADPRVTSHALVHHLARALSAPSGAVTAAGTAAASEDTGGALAAFGRWLTASGAPQQQPPSNQSTPVAARSALLVALLAVEPTLDAVGDAEPDVRALLVRALGAEHPTALDVAGPATRALVGALIDALADAAEVEVASLPGSPAAPEAERRARARDRASRAAASLLRIVDVPPPPVEPTLRGPNEPIVGADAQRWTAWWRAAAGRPQAAELAAHVARGGGPDPEPVRFRTPLPDRPGARFGNPGSALTRALAELFAGPRPDAWRVLERGLGGALERVDELGLRGELRRALAAARADSTLSPEERAARARVQRALGRSTERS